MAEIHKMTFICDEMSTAMFRKLYEQKKTSRFCDLTLNVNNKIVRAHRNVLACSSPYFNSILKHHTIIREQLNITCLDSEIFNTIINYMYTGHITIELSNVEELLRLADHFILTKIIEYCIEFLGANLNVANCLFTYYLSQRFKLKHLCNIVEGWIINHLNEICDGKEILNLNLLELQDFLKSRVFNISSFKAVYIISEWILRNTRMKEKDCMKLLNCVHWTNFEPTDIFRYLESFTIFSKSELCFYYFLCCLFQNSLLLPSFRNKYDELHIKYGTSLLNDDKGSDAEKLADNKIIVTEPSKSSLKNNGKMVHIKPKLRNQKQRLLKRLLFCSLKPSLRMFLYKHHKVLFGNCDKNSVEDNELEKKTCVKCPICFTSINDSLLLEQHLALSHAKDVTYKCGICTFVCQYHGDYLNHMKNHFSGPPYKCDFCDLTTDHITKLIAHRSKHLDESVYQCSFCSFKCRLKQNFVSHLKIHTPEKQFKCDNCTKTFRYKHNLESHKATHTSDKNLICDSCGFHTKFLSHMIAHKRIHAADIYRCSYPHCKYSTSKKNQLLSHSKSHNGVRPHSCGICGRGFMEKSHLVRHERIHLEEKPFKCSNCDYASSRRDKLKEHFTRHHGENASAKVPYKARPMRNCGSKPKPQTTQESSASTNTNSITFTQTNTTPSTTAPPQPIGSELQDLIMHHQNHPTSSANNISGINTNYHHFAESSDFHNHSHTHNIQHQILASTHNQRAAQHQNTTVNHHMLARTNHTSATSTAAAVAAAMMLDPRFHHNSSVPYHPSTTPASMAMAAAVQSSQQIQNSAATQHGEYPPTLQNCMTLF
ncbi:hypothetical protein RI129_005807 [Pyrocoelia pectoralis]|uniref:Uncharacterized protein n=1 Tax=Pyrocoelia pectoralis TaxID=417401 RepID=A0AAN7ZHS3_9COLE